MKLKNKLLFVSMALPAVFFMLAISLYSGCHHSKHIEQNIGIELGEHSAVTPVHRDRPEWWGPRHQQVLDRVKQGNVGLILVGD